MANNATNAGVGLPAGTKIGKYEVRERLAMGGQAILYTCYDALLDRYVAVKQISSHLSEDPKFLERFRREAVILAKLGTRQPAIVTIYELVEDERGLFIVMEHVEGHTIERTLADNPDPVEPKAVLQILWRLAGALNDVHNEGIIHRDIKPGNIILCEGLRPKITDFGVAATVSGQTSMLLGTTKYMAPELLSGMGFDGRADMYSLGFVAYEMLIGREKFNEVFADVVRDKHSESLRWMKWHSNPSVQAPEAHEVVPAVPEPLSKIVAKMMAKNPDDRYPNMEALGKAIKEGFSPRAKAVAAAAGHGHRRHRRHHAEDAAAEAVAAEPALLTEAGAEAPVLSGEGPATAPIPKRTISKRTKFIAAGALALVLILCGVIVIAIRSGESERLKAQAKTLFDEGWAAYEKADYAAAAAKLDKLYNTKVQGKNDYLYFGSDEYSKASILLPICESYDAIAHKDWEKAETKREQATQNREKINKQGSGGVLEFSRKMEGDISDLERVLTNVKAFNDAMKTARDLRDGKDYRKARDALQPWLADPATPAMKTQVKEFLAAMDQEEMGGIISADLAKANTLAKDGFLSKAEEQYRLVLVEIDDKDKGGKLADDVRKKLKADTLAGLNSVTGSKNWGEVVAEINARRAANDRPGELDAIRRALKIKKDSALEDREKELQMLIAFEAGQKEELQKHWDAARQQYVNALRFRANPQIDAALERISGYEKREKALRDGWAVFSGGKWADALTQWEAALKMAAPPGTDDNPVKAKMLECRFNIGLAEADKLRDDKQYDEAIAAYEKLRELGMPEKDAIINAREKDLRDTREYEKYIAGGDKALMAGDWGKALDEYGKAQKIKNTPEVQTKIKFTHFSENLTQAQNALDSGNKNMAKGYAKLAKSYASNERENKLADDIINKAEG